MPPRVENRRWKGVRGNGGFRDYRFNNHVDCIYDLNFSEISLRVFLFFSFKTECGKTELMINAHGINKRVIEK